MVLDTGQVGHFIGSVPLELKSLENVILFFGAEMTPVMQVVLNLPILRARKL